MQQNKSDASSRVAHLVIRDTGAEESVEKTGCDWPVSRSPVAKHIYFKASTIRKLFQSLHYAQVTCFDRLRAMHRRRLQTANLWSHPGGSGNKLKDTARFRCGVLALHRVHV